MQRYNIKVKAFNTILILEINKVKDYEKLVDKIVKLVGYLHSSFNIYDQNSEIYKLNESLEIKPSPYLKDILEKVKKYEQLTDYHFNTNQLFKEDNNIEINDKKIKIKNKIDLGGIAKGYFLAIIKQFLKDKNLDYEIDFGGALLFEKSRYIKIRDLKDVKKNILQIKLEGGYCINTSSFYWQTKENTTHIYQKEKGYDISYKSISVIDKNPILSDAISTALYSMTLEQGLEFIKKYNLLVIYNYEDYIYVSKEVTIKKVINKALKIVTI